MRTIETKRIGELAKVKGGKRLPIGMEVQDELTEHPYLRIVDFSVNGVDRSSIKYISNEAFEFVKRYIISNDDVYISIAGTIGRVGIVPTDLSGANLTENAAKITEIDSSIDKTFLMYFLRSSLGQGSIQSKTGGTSQPKLALFRIEEIEVPFLLLNEQKRIAEILSAYDDLIENNLKRIRLLEESARLLYREWFVRLKFPNHEHTPLIDGLPEGWEKLAVPKFIEVNPRTPIDKDKENCFIEMANLSNDSMLVSSLQRKKGNSGSKFQKGDTLFARITPCLENGKTGFVNFLEEGEVGFGSTEFIVLRPKTVSPEFVYCLSRTYHFRENAIKNMVGSSGRQRVKTSCFDEFFVDMPPQKILDEFESITKPCFRQIRNLQMQNQKLKQARDLLLPRLMSGEIVV